MATRIISSDVIAEGVAVDLAEDEDVFLRAGATVGSSDEVAIRGEGGGHRLIIEGDVAASATAIALGGSPGQDAGEEVYVRGGATVSSTEAAAIAIAAQASVVDNAGEIIGEEAGVVFTAAADGTGSTLANSGLISGGDVAIAHRAVGENAEALTILNRGAIEGGSFSFDAGDAAAVERIVNTGSMTGDVSLGAGDDLYDGRSGAIDGRVLGGGGADSLYGGEGDDVLNGGGGDDLLRAGPGADSLYGGSGSDTLVGGDDGGGRLVGGVGADRIVGSNGNDAIVGGGGDDVLVSSFGQDSIRGGGGADVLQFDSRLGPGSLAVVFGFSGGAGDGDSLLLDSDVFLGLGAGPLAAGSFAVNATGQAADGDDRIIYDRSSGRMFFDVDGAGGANGVLFASFVGKPIIDADDILVA